MRHPTILRLALLVALLALGLAPLSAGAVTGIPAGATITSATLTVNVISFDNPPGTYGVHVHPVTDQWVESNVTWNVRNTGLPWTTPGGGGDFGPEINQMMVSGLGPASVNVTSFVQAVVNGTQVNNGLLLRFDPVHDIKIDSSEAAVVANRPKLTICYTTASNPTPTCLTYQQGVLGNANDSFLNQIAPDVNFGSSLFLRVANLGPGLEKRALIQMNFQIIP